MDHKTNSSPSLAAISGDLIQLAEESPKGVLLFAVKPQPVCKLVYANTRKVWVYPHEDTWKKWFNPSYRCPNELGHSEREKTWTPPFHAGDRVYAREPWAFRKCCDCYACETPQATYCGKKGCFVYPTPQNQEYMRFQPANQMPLAAARTFLRITSVQMMRLQEVPVEQFRQKGFVFPDGTPFPEDIRPLWEKSLGGIDFPLYSWEGNPFVWVIFFEK